jgi:hypothetical protein
VAAPLSGDWQLRQLSHSPQWRHFWTEV